MSAYAPRHAPPPHLTPVRLAGLDAAVLAVAVLALIVALLAMTRPAPAAVSMPSAPAATSAPVRTAPPAATPQRPARPRLGHAHGVHPYTVRPGDSLWSVSLRAYGTGHDWGRIYAANRAAIGGNPSLIRAGELLIIPRTSDR